MGPKADNFCNPKYRNTAETRTQNIAEFALVRGARTFPDGDEAVCQAVRLRFCGNCCDSKGSTTLSSQKLMSTWLYLKNLCNICDCVNLVKCVPAGGRLHRSHTATNACTAGSRGIYSVLNV